MELTSRNLAEIGLACLIILILIWLWNPFTALWICLILPSVSFSILLLSIIIQQIEYARIPLWYYGLMIIFIACPILVLVFFGVLENFQFLKNIQ